jgi:hypothetical protein
MKLLVMQLLLASSDSCDSQNEEQYAVFSLYTSKPFLFLAQTYVRRNRN